MTAHLGIIGYPLEHSVSPAFQNAALQHLKIDAIYERWATQPNGLAKRIRSLREPGVWGANITVPYKEEVIPLLDDVDAGARRIGAVNTIVQDDGGLIGYNTDAWGFIRSLREEAGFDPAGKRAMLIGAGGAARAVAFALADGKAASIVINNRSLAHAQALAQAITTATGVRSTGFSPPEISPPSPHHPAPDLLVNCTPLGMRGGPDEGHAPNVARFISLATLVCDLVYNPQETPLLRLAREHGAPVLGGLGMLVYQGAAAFKLWTGQEAPVLVMYAAARRALSPVIS